MNGIRMPRGFQGKLLLAFAGLLTLTVVTVGIAVSLTSSSQVREQMRQKALVGSHVLDSFLNTRSEQLEAAVLVLTNDFGFRSAVATGDAATIASALDNHGRRIDADLVVLVNGDGNELSANATAGDRDFPFHAALRQARQSGSASSTAWYEGVLYQYFVVPVMAPEPIAWVVMAFAIDRAIARDLAELTDLEVTFAGFGRDDRVAAVVSTLPAGQVDGLLTSLEAYTPTRDPEILYTNRDAYLSTVRPLSTIDGGRAFAVLQMPTRIISETIWLLIGQLAAVLAVALALTLTLSLWLARRMSDPVRGLIAAARSIEQGDYDTPVQIADGSELAHLGLALNTMQDGIREREARIRHQAYHDDLTGLPNLRRLEQLCNEQPGAFTLCLLAMLNLKDVSFSFGYDISNALLVAVAERLRRQPDLIDVARVGGNEFAVILPDLPPGEAVERAGALQARISGSYAIGERTVCSQFACAVIGFPRDAGDFQTLYRGAETTLAAARGADDGCMTYLPGHEQVRARQLQIIAGFDTACADGQLSLRYQPKVDLTTRQVCECEALLRWQHPALGFIPPDEFILLAERSGNIRRLSDWVLETAIAQVGRWQRDGVDLAVAVNLSAHDLADARLHEVIQQAMTRHGVSGDRLVMEITESAVMRDRERASEALLRLKALGIRLSIDDFGTGHSSLAQLKKLPVDELKIDKSFVLDLDGSADDALIVNSTIELGHRLGLTVVAEGVENAASLALLVDYACDKVQGYHFSKPLTAPELAAWLTTVNEQHHQFWEATG